MVINTQRKQPAIGHHRYGLLLTVLLLWVPAAVPADSVPLDKAPGHRPLLSPYRASYRINYHNIGSTLKRQLKKSGDNRWQLSNSLELFLVGFNESSLLRLDNQQIVPLRYNFENELSSGRNSDLHFNWEAGTVTDPARNHSSKLASNTLDSLSFQLQLRQDMITANGQLTDKVYQLAVGKRVKNYRVTLLGEENLTTPAGTFLASKLQQYRPGKNRYTTIWLAKEKQYFLLRLDRVENQQTTYSLELNKAMIDGLPL